MTERQLTQSRGAAPEASGFSAVLEAESQSRRIATNTALLYFRTLLGMGVSLYATRVALKVLGASDFGTFHVVGGLVALLSFLPTSMAMATQRFLSHALGQRDERTLREVFCVNMALYAILAVVGVACLETLGLFYLRTFLNVSPERLPTATVIYHLSVVGFTVSLLASPFMAMIVAHEHMHVYARMSLVDAVLKLASAYALTVLPGDALLTFSVLTLTTSALVSLLYVVVCVKAYPECRGGDFLWPRRLAREILSFTGWSLFGSITTVGRTQMLTVLLNQYFGPATVAARAIALSVSNNVGSFSQNLNTSLYAPIIKSYASGQHGRFLELLFNGCKAMFFLMWLLALPVMLEMETILGLWLGTVPQYTALFARLALVEVLIAAMSHPLMTAARAPGKMGAYETTLGLIQLAMLAVCWIALQNGAPAYAVYVVTILGNAVMFLARLLLLRRSIQLPVALFAKRVVLPSCFAVLLSGGLGLVLSRQVHAWGWPAMLSVPPVMITTAVAIYLVGLDSTLRTMSLRLMWGATRRMLSWG
jgi:O-antigen/teichoic acid export membrane protein